MQNEMRKLIGLPKDWTIEVDVRPYLMYDMGYEVDAKKKHITVLVYSARYPQSWQMWYETVAKQIWNYLLHSTDADLEIVKM